MKRILLTFYFISIACISMSIDRKVPFKPFAGPTYDTIFPPPDMGFKKVGYLEINPREKDSFDYASLENKMQAINILLYSCASIEKGAAYLYFSRNFQRIKEIANNKGVKLFISIKANDTKKWDSVSATEPSRLLFVKSVLKILRRYELDGVDIDWEFPTTRDSSAGNFTKLIRLLGDSCHRNGKYYLSAAIISGYHSDRVNASKREAINDSLLSGNSVDFFNIMAYDNYDITNSFQHHSTYEFAEHVLKYWIKSRNMPPCKAVLGVPLYAHSVFNNKLEAQASYKTLIHKYGADPDLNVFFLNDSTGEKIYNYNGKIILEAKYKLAQRKAGGIMFWQIGYDTKEDSTSLLDFAGKLKGEKTQGNQCAGSAIK